MGLNFEQYLVSYNKLLEIFGCDCTKRCEVVDVEIIEMRGGGPEFVLSSDIIIEWECVISYGQRLIIVPSTFPETTAITVGETLTWVA